MNNKILTQGHFDGFCLLYAICNAYKTLMKPNQTACEFAQNNAKKWCKIISNTPSLHQFASGEGSDFGVATDKLDVEVKGMFIQTCFKLLTENTKNVITVEPLEFDNILSVDLSKSTIILCLNEKAAFEHGSVGDHWVAIIGNESESKKLNVACSYSQLENGFNENKTLSDRYYNNSLPYSEIKKNRLWVNSIYLITNEKA